MLNIVRLVLVAYAVLLIVGGILGYTEKGSIISIVAGVVCGILAGIGAAVLLGNPKLGLGLAIGATILVLGGQTPRFLKAEQKKLWPGGVTIATSALVLVLSTAALATLAKKP
jgi:uncharacterized membrane protein (UPF0136 family)